ncbi:hypothetical protein [Ramlibacter algicola]|uniref:Uncharacterized protein n=1 Tax=Ramlibacter algicola TaxID=2795217 RepID=A0A934URQ0_9BURK|nr:hypothetical protein [Ramlibacter algicola]MBK0392767.1 hypothetical protein [Ramlibacter algicola]
MGLDSRGSPDHPMPRSYSGHFRIACIALAGLALLLFLLSLLLRGSPDEDVQAFAHGCRAVLPWVAGLALISGLLAYALRPGEDVASPTGEPTEFSPDVTEFGRTTVIAPDPQDAADR